MKKEPEFFHRIWTLPGQQFWANFEPDRHICPPEFKIYSYFRKHIPTNQSFEAQLITTNGDNFLYLLNNWKTDKWVYTPKL